MSELKIIPVIESELEKLKYLSIKPFQETFSDQNTDDNMNKYLRLNVVRGTISAPCRPICTDILLMKSQITMVYTSSRVPDRRSPRLSCQQQTTKLTVD